MRMQRLFVALAVSGVLLGSEAAVMAAGQEGATGSNRTGTGGAVTSEETLKHGMAAEPGTMRAADIVKLSVKNNEGVSLGKIEDLVIDRHTGKVTFAALGSGGVLGFGEKLHLVPWSAISLHLDANKTVDFALLDISHDRFKEAPTFEWSSLQQLSNPEFAGSIEKFYSKTSTAGRSTTEKR